MKKPRVRYTVRITSPSTHRVQVEMSVDQAEEGGVFLTMPVWTPGSYLVREYSRHVSRMTARRVSGDEVPVTKVEKNTWRVDTKPGKRVDISWEVYANELTVRTSHVDADHAFLHPPGIFLYVRGREAEPCRVTVEPPAGWEVATALPLTGENTFEATDLDHLVDSPIEIGTHQTLSFDLDGTPHRVALYGEGNYDREDLLADTHDICRAQREMFGGEHPCRAYTFLFHVLEGAGGGLEHKDSSVCAFSPLKFRPERSYIRQLGLISHEYFHTWNVKRIRPRELGPFDYTKENHTRLLWLAEGFTTFYQYRFLRKAGLASVPVYLDELALSIRGFLENPGRLVDPVAESSFDAWIKLYRPDENTRNATVSYYLKGGLVALLLDLVIRDETDGERSLDDVMRSLWQSYLADPERGYDEEEVKAALESAAGRSMESEIDRWVHGTEELPFEEHLSKVGLSFKPRKKEGTRPWLGVTTKKVDGKLSVREVLAGSPAEAAGLNSGDELVALDGWRLGKLQDLLNERETGSEVDFTICRFGRLREIRVALGEAPLSDRVLRPLADAGERQKRLFEGWAYGPLDEAGSTPPAAPKPPRPSPV